MRISAAASLTNAVKEIATLYAGEHPGARILPNFGSSGTLARQIAEGAPADLFLSANPKWMEYLVGLGKVPAERVRELAGNSLVFVGAPNPQVQGMADLPKLRHIALGSPNGVPAGQYAAQALRRLELYQQLAAGGRLVMAKDVRQALIYADREEADGAFVYRTDAPLAKKAVILFAVPQDLYDPVTCPVGLTAEGAKNPLAIKFL